MPAEWERQRLVWLAWPHDPKSWPGRKERVREVFASLCAELSRDAAAEGVAVLVEDEEVGAQARRLVIAAGGAIERVAFHQVAIDDVWLRDCGPTFVVRRHDDAVESALVGWRFDGWGGKYPCAKDAKIPVRMASLLKLPFFEPDLVFEGGSIDVDGQGTALTTEQCLLAANRNPGYSRARIEALLRDYLGVTTIVWLGNGLEGDDTDGHIDNLARFVAPGVVVASDTADRSDPNHLPLRENIDRLSAAKDAIGRTFRVIRLPTPPARFAEGRRLPCSYANFLITDGKVLVPTFACAEDAVALETLGELFPGRRTVGIDARELLLEGGAIHCLTQQQPLG